MALPNIFTKEVSEQMIGRINSLTAETKAKWGTMTVDQMFAHCNVSYEMAFEDKHKKPNGFARFLLKSFIKNSVVSEKPYSKGGRTAPAFLITDKRNFENEKTRLTNYIKKCVELGENHFEGKESLSFGKMTKTEWNNQFYKHLDHHLSQFGA
ncbi:MAG: DUF1569 domain-containing protein [Crocinitomicaceae bacterium]|nr:DUF1569 domain-containing protein [Crocinitomicaceae bacterium]MBK9593675.1 DUF1569 domain-containing protein [Crocinitomicaceae bacterium]